jgi:hypothetical protein
MCRKTRTQIWQKRVLNFPSRFESADSDEWGKTLIEPFHYTRSEDRMEGGGTNLSKSIKIIPVPVSVFISSGPYTFFAIPGINWDLKQWGLCSLLKEKFCWVGKSCKKLQNCGLYYKSFTIVIYGSTIVCFVLVLPMKWEQPSTVKSVFQLIHTQSQSGLIKGTERWGKKAR